MVNMNEVANAKALVGAVFIEYLVYSIVYIIEGSRYDQFYNQENETKA